jgi:hypothetical protein
MLHRHQTNIHQQLFNTHRKRRNSDPIFRTDKIHFDLGRKIILGVFLFCCLLILIIKLRSSPPVENEIQKTSQETIITTTTTTAPEPVEPLFDTMFHKSYVIQIQLTIQKSSTIRTIHGRDHVYHNNSRILVQR